MAKILVVEDDQSLSDVLAYNLRQEGHTPISAGTPRQALELAARESLDLVLLDLMLPGGSGFDVCRSIRTFSTVPIIMLTARDEDVDRVLGLEIGADDYVTKPVKLRELLARIKANLRRVEFDQQDEDAGRLSSAGLVIDVQQRRVEVKGEQVLLQPREFDLLVHLMRHPGVVLTRQRLLHNVWGHQYVGERTVDVHVRRVRAKLERGSLAHLIRTVHGVGYAFEASE
ncbi:MAG: response regulator [Chloroflexota bacterium]